LSRVRPSPQVQRARVAVQKVSLPKAPRRGRGYEHAPIADDQKIAFPQRITYLRTGRSNPFRQPTGLNSPPPESSSSPDTDQLGCHTEVVAEPNTDAQPPAGAPRGAGQAPRHTVRS